MSGLLRVSPSPHIRHNATTAGIMRDVLIALIPAAVTAVIYYGTRSLLVIAVCVASCVLFESAFELAVKRPNTVRDLSAVITGVILAYNLPPEIPLWQAVVGSFVAIVLVKQLFGGIGKNFANPAITARIFMLLAFTAPMSAWVHPDGVSSATPLAIISGSAEGTVSAFTLLLGQHGGCIGETSTAALLLGGVYLLVRRIISWETPVVFIAVVFVLSALAGWNPVHSVLAGGLVLGAVFMATDYATTPVTFWGRVIFGFGAGVLTVVIRVYGSYPEGVSYAILLMNILTPYINRLTPHKPLGSAKT